MQKKIAISGASGLIGQALVRAMRSWEVEVYYLRRLKSKGRQPVAESTLDSPSESVINWDPDAGLVNPSELEGFHAVIHLAGRSIDAARWSEMEKGKLRDSRVKATQQLAKQIAQLDRRPEVFISASAIGYYGNCGDQWVTESHAAAQDDFLGSMAAEWEAASQPLSELGIRVIHARFGIVLSSDGGALGKVIPLFKKGLGGKLGSGNQYWSWVSLEDCVRAIEFLFDNQTAQGAFNIVSPNPVTNTEFTRLLGQALGRPAIFPAPKFALRLALGEMADALLLSSCRVQPKRITDLGFTFNQPQLKEFLISELKK